MRTKPPIAILGAGNIGTCIAKGLVDSGSFQAEKIILTRRTIHLLDPFKAAGYTIVSDNILAIKKADIVIVAVEPQQLNALMEEIQMAINPERHILVSVVSGVSIEQIKKYLGTQTTVVRVMPNTAISVRESMTCIAAEKKDRKAIRNVTAIFNTVGKTLVIDEADMTAATALGACGIAFFMRAIRAASQGGIEIGFHAEDALTIASQTAKGAASLLLSLGKHPEYEIDKVTTPRGCTIAGLNGMEHEGFSSALIKGITISAEKAAKLYV